MISHPSLDLVRFIQTAFERSVSAFHRAINGLGDNDLYYQPTKDSNSIAWLAWQMGRRNDYYSAKLVGDDEIWATQGWASRFGMPAQDIGLGHTPEQVAAFKPRRDLLIGYVEAAQRVANDRLSRMTAGLLDREVELDAGRGMRPAWQILHPLVNNCLQRAGEIAYVRGMISGIGWSGR